jgi:hypothetical protein
VTNSLPASVTFAAPNVGNALRAAVSASQGCERVKITVDQRTRLGEFSGTIFKPMNWPFQGKRPS